MTATMTKAPKFRPTQRVSFVGGEGIVRSYRPNAGSWTYLVEMPLGLYPDFGRVGAETMVYLNEADLRTTMAFNEVRAA
ncbi:MAG TPA: hypothetical protein V6D18_11840 [Thermosynechococcaceae cyanobacterium]